MTIAIGLILIFSAVVLFLSVMNLAGAEIHHRELLREYERIRKEYDRLGKELDEILLKHGGSNE